MPSSLPLQAFHETLCRKADAFGRNLLANQFMVAFELCPQRCCYVSQHAEKVLGYASSQLDCDLLDQAIHPHDRPFVRRASELTASFRQFLKPSGIAPPPAPASALISCSSIDYRLRSSSGMFLRVLRQDFVLAQDATAKPLAMGNIFTDITRHKTSPEVRLSLDHPGFACWLHSNKTPTATDALSVREHEIMDRMLVGEANANIAKELFISDLTLKTHRRNIYRKLRIGEQTSASLKQRERLSVPN